MRVGHMMSHVLYKASFIRSLTYPVVWRMKESRLCRAQVSTARLEAAARGCCLLISNAFILIQ